MYSINISKCSNISNRLVAVNTPTSAVSAIKEKSEEVKK